MDDAVASSVAYVNQPASSVRTTLEAPTRCPHDRRGLAFYRGRFTDWRAVRGVQTPYPAGRKPRNCADAHYLAELWTKRSLAARRASERYLEKLLNASTWLEAVSEVQVVFPNTDGWLLSCSAAESNHYEWVGYGSVPYSDALRDSNTVGGYLQFRFQTFKGMWRHGVAYAVSRGYRIPKDLLGDSLAAKTRAWRSALGQAVAGGWARFTGHDDSHWSASWNTGCR